MMRDLIAGTAMLALCTSSLAPALAQEHRFAGFDAPRGTTAAVRLRIPLGGSQGRARRPSVGFTLGQGIEQAETNPGGGTSTRQLRLLELSLDREGIRDARLAGFDIRALEGQQPRLGIAGDTKNGAVIFLAFLLSVLAGIILLDGGDRDDRPPPDYEPPSTGG